MNHITFKKLLVVTVPFDKLYKKSFNSIGLRPLVPPTGTIALVEWIDNDDALMLDNDDAQLLDND